MEIIGELAVKSNKGVSCVDLDKQSEHRSSRLPIGNAFRASCARQTMAAIPIRQRAGIEVTRLGMKLTGRGRGLR